MRTRTSSTTALISLSAAASLLLLAGCSSSPPPRPRTPINTTASTTVTRPAPLTGPAEYGTVSRELAAIEQAPIDRVYQATQDALHDLELRLVEKTKDRLNATVGARTAHDDRITVSLARVTGGVTDVKIRVGFWGDEAQSRAILTEIRKRLSDAPAAKPADAADNTLDPNLLTDPGILAAGPKPAPIKAPPAKSIAPATRPVAPSPATKPAAPATTPAPSPRR